MLDLASASRAQFEPFTGQTFELVATTGRIPLTLAQVRRLGPARTGTVREPFALTFHGAPTLRLPQQIRRLEHPALGVMEIFLVQNWADATSSKFEAIFN